MMGDAECKLTDLSGSSRYFETDDKYKSAFMGVIYIFCGAFMCALTIWGSIISRNDHAEYSWILYFSIPFAIALVYIGLISIGIGYIVFDESNGNIYSYITSFCGLYKKIKKIGCMEQFKQVNITGYISYAVIFEFKNNCDPIIIRYQNCGLSTATHLAVAIDQYWNDYINRQKKINEIIDHNNTETVEVTTKEESTIGQFKFYVTEEDYKEMLEIQKRYSLSIGLQE
eukprot:232873_1